jgi:CRP-like cAMP-binding protein
MSQQSCLTCSNESCFVRRYANHHTKELINKSKNLLIFKNHQQILFEGSSVTGIFFIYSGNVKVYKGHPDTKDYQIIRLSKAGDILGHRGFGGSMIYPISATAITDCKLCFIPKDIFQEAMVHNHDLTYQLMMYYLSELNIAESKLYHYIRMSVKSRIADVILGLIQICGFQKTDDHLLCVSVSRKDIANMAGTTYETALRFLNEMTEDNVIEFQKKSIRIVDHKKLNEISLSNSE